MKRELIKTGLIFWKQIWDFEAGNKVGIIYWEFQAGNLSGIFLFQLYIDDEILSYETITNLTILPKNHSTAEPMVEFMLTAFDQYGVPFGHFIENQRYLKTVNCENQGLKKQYTLG